MVSYLMETCTTSDTSLATWYRTTKLTCRGRLQDRGVGENQYGGPGQVQRIVMRLYRAMALPLGFPFQEFVHLVVEQVESSRVTSGFLP